MWSLKFIVKTLRCSAVFCANKNWVDFSQLESLGHSRLVHSSNWKNIACPENVGYLEYCMDQPYATSVSLEQVIC